MTDSTPIRIAVPRETAPGERRVALVPDAAARLVKAGLAVAVEAGAGLGAHFDDDAYAAAGAAVAPTAAALYESADVVLKVRCPSAEEALGLRAGSLLIAFLQPGRDAAALKVLAGRRVTALSMDLVPRITRAQAMDALSSQATVAGYGAVLLGATELGKMLPMLVTAAGTLAPATVLVLGAGVAGLQAIATARRLGANVRAYDIRPEVKEEIESLGGTFVAADAVVAGARDEQGYALEVGDEVRRRQEAALAQHVADADLLITTAQVPGRRAPVLVTVAMVERMRPGAVIVDVAAESGGNCALTQPGRDVVHGGVTILGPVNLPSRMPVHASQMYARNVTTVLLHIVRDGALALDPADPIVQAMRVTESAGKEAA